MVIVYILNTKSKDPGDLAKEIFLCGLVFVYNLVD